jgi:hypothetical protein
VIHVVFALGVYTRSLHGIFPLAGRKQSDDRAYGHAHAADARLAIHDSWVERDSR